LYKPGWKMNFIKGIVLHVIQVRTGKTMLVIKLRERQTISRVKKGK